ncbi:MAG: universal stress protein [Bacteroidales bacterium]|nr:universal stress protein [Bacteroidales bacterium]
MKKELKNILVPIDFNKPSNDALYYAFSLSNKIKSDIVVVNIIETPGLLSDFFSNGDKLVQITNKVKEKLTKIISSLKVDDGTINISSKVKRGKPYKKILEIVNEINARMIILGENHQRKVIEQELGSTVYHVTLKSPIPVLTIKGNTNKIYDKIVVPLDLTKQMRRLLFIVMVYGINYEAHIHLVLSLIGGIKMRDSRIFKKLKLAKKTLEENGITTTSKHFPRDQEPSIKKVLQYAGDIDTGLILVMTHREGYTCDNYIGALTHHIINKSKVPVLSLISAATVVDFTQFFKGIVDPVEMLLNK